MWRYLMTPSNFDGRELRGLERVAAECEAGGMLQQAEALRAFAAAVRPLLTWYGSALNQIGHGWLGIVLSALLSGACAVLFGELPHKAAVMGGLIGAYLCMEIFIQGWRAGDSWFDSAKFALGVSLTQLPFQETGIPLRVDVNPVVLISILALSIALLALRSLKRYDAKGRQP